MGGCEPDTRGIANLQSQLHNLTRQTFVMVDPIGTAIGTASLVIQLFDGALKGK